MSDVDATSVAAIGGRVRALREAMDLSLRDLAERCGVSAPMLSQVERGETSPTLQVAARIAAGLDLRLSQLLRLDEDGAVTIVRARERRQGRRRADGPPLRDPDARRCPASAPSSRATCSRPAPRPAAPATRRCTSPAAARPRSSSRGRVVLHCDGAAHELADGRLRHVRRRPAAPLREPRTRGGVAAGGRLRRPATQLATRSHRMPRRCSTRSGPPTRWPPACSTSTCTWSTRSRARRRSTGCGSPAARSAGPTARSPRPTTTCRPTARPSPRASATSSRRVQVETLERNCAEFGVPVYSLGSDRQGIVHVIGPELGVTQPGMTIVCGDSPHRHARRVRRARLRHRHERGRARARDAVPRAAQAEVDADPLRGRARASASPPRT